jgi:hemerythrin superfamily protein
LFVWKEKHILIASVILFLPPHSELKMMHSDRQSIDEQVLQDHQKLRSFYDNYKSTGDMKWYNQFVYEFCRHSVGEEIIMYPLLDSFGSEGKRLVDEARTEHQRIKEMMSSMESMSRDSSKERFNNQFDILMQILGDHMQKAESVDLMLIRSRCSLDDRIHYGQQFMNRKKIAPTRPHPSTPETPVMLEEAMGLLVAPIDKFRDMFRSFPGKEK